MTWKLNPIGGGSGGTSVVGISDVTGIEPIAVDSPTATTRRVYINEGPPPNAALLPSGALPSFARRRVGFTSALNNVTGLVSFAQQSTVTASVTTNALVANTTFFTSATRVLYTSPAPVDTRTGILLTTNEVFRGNVANTGGFIFEIIFAFLAANATSRFFCGLYGTNALPALAADPVNLTDGVWLGLDSADANFQIMHNDNAGTATKVDLGANFPRPAGAALSRDVYYLMLYCQPNVAGTAQGVSYYLLRMDDITKMQNGLLTTAGGNLPTASTLLYPAIAFGTGPSSAVAVQYAFMRTQTETAL